LLLLDSLIVNKHNEDIGNCQALIYFDGISSSVIKLTQHANEIIPDGKFHEKAGTFLGADPLFCFPIPGI